MTISEMQELRKQKGYSYEMVAKLSRYGIKNEKDLATKISIPLKALITKDKDGDSPLEIVKKLAFKRANGNTLKDIATYMFPFVTSGIKLYLTHMKDLDTEAFDSSMTSSFGTMFKVVRMMEGSKMQSGQMSKIKEIRKNIQETRSLIKQIQSTDTDKLKYASTLMSKLAQFSASINGNFKELARTINKELIAALKDLEDTLDDLKDGIDVNVNGGIGGASHLGNIIQKPSSTISKDDKKPQKRTKVEAPPDKTYLYEKNALNEIADDVNAIRYYFTRTNGYDYGKVMR